MMDFFKTLLDSEEIIRTGGWILILLIVYAENGLFFGFFLPGDYLLFAAGLFCGIGILNVPIVFLVISIMVAAILGSYTGYFFGNYVGTKLFYKNDSMFFKHKYLVQTRAYYLKYGGKTLIISRFLPILRTFAPILAGVVKMDFKKFSTYIFAGGIIWVFLLVFGGYFLGHRFPNLIHYLEYIILGFLVITSVIVVNGILRVRQKTKKSSHLVI